MARLPLPGSDSDNWGAILNEFLYVGHNTDGTLKVPAPAYPEIATDGVLAGARKRIAFMSSGAATVTATDDPVNDQVIVAVNAVSPVIARRTTDYPVVTNTTIDSTVADLVLPGGTVQAEDAVVFECGGTLLNNSGAAIGTSLGVTLGGVVTLHSSPINITSNANARKWHLRVMVVCPTSTTQKLTSVFSFSLGDAFNWGGGSAAPVGYATSAVNTAADTTIAFTVQPSLASPLYEIKAAWATLTRMQ